MSYINIKFPQQILWYAKAIKIMSIFSLAVTMALFFCCQQISFVIFVVQTVSMDIVHWFMRYKKKNIDFMQIHTVKSVEMFRVNNENARVKY